MMSPTAAPSHPQRGPGGVVRRYPATAKRIYEVSYSGDNSPVTPGRGTIGRKRLRRPTSPPYLKRPETQDMMRERRARAMELAAMMRLPRTQSLPGAEGGSAPTPYARGWLPALSNVPVTNPINRASPSASSTSSRQPLPPVGAVNSAVRVYSGALSPSARSVRSRGNEEIDAKESDETQNILNLDMDGAEDAEEEGQGDDAVDDEEKEAAAAATEAVDQQDSAFGTEVEDEVNGEAEPGDVTGKDGEVDDAVSEEAAEIDVDEDKQEAADELETAAEDSSNTAEITLEATENVPDAEGALEFEEETAVAEKEIPEAEVEAPEAQEETAVADEETPEPKEVVEAEGEVTEVEEETLETTEETPEISDEVEPAIQDEDSEILLDAPSDEPIPEGDTPVEDTQDAVEEALESSKIALGATDNASAASEETPEAAEEGAEALEEAPEAAKEEAEVLEAAEEGAEVLEVAEEGVEALETAEEGAEVLEAAEEGAEVLEAAEEEVEALEAAEEGAEALEAAEEGAEILEEAEEGAEALEAAEEGEEALEAAEGGAEVLEAAEEEVEALEAAEEGAEALDAAEEGAEILEAAEEGAEALEAAEEGEEALEAAEKGEEVLEAAEEGAGALEAAEEGAEVLEAAEEEAEASEKTPETAEVVVDATGEAPHVSETTESLENAEEALEAEGIVREEPEEIQETQEAAEDVGEEPEAEAEESPDGQEGDTGQNSEEVHQVPEVTEVEGETEVTEAPEASSEIPENQEETAKSPQEELQDYDILVINSDGENTEDDADGSQNPETEAAPAQEEIVNEENPDFEDKGTGMQGEAAEGQVTEGEANPEDEEEAVEDDLAPYEQMVQVIRSGDEEEQLAAVYRTRKQLSHSEGSPIEEYLKAGILPPLKDCLEKHHNPKLQFEALWVLTNIASGTTEQTKAVVDADLLPVFLRLLSSNSPDVREQAVWAVGNIMGDSPELRDRVIEEGAIPRLYDLVPSDSKQSSPGNLCWTFTNVFRRYPWHLEDEQLAMCRKAVTVFFYSDNEDTLVDALWTIAFMTNGGGEHLDWVVESGFVPKLVEILQSGNLKQIKPTLHIFRNLLNSPKHRTEVALRSPLVLSVLHLSASHATAIRMEAVQVLDIIVRSGEPELLEAALDADLPTGLIIMNRNKDPVVRRVAGNAALVVARDTNIDRLVSLASDQRYVMALKELLARKESELVMNGLEATLTAVQRCSEAGYDLGALESLLASQRMVILSKNEHPTIKTLASAAVSYYRNNHEAN